MMLRSAVGFAPSHSFVISVPLSLFLSHYLYCLYSLYYCFAYILIFLCISLQNPLRSSINQSGCLIRASGLTTGVTLVPVPTTIGQSDGIYVPLISRLGVTEPSVTQQTRVSRCIPPDSTHFSSNPLDPGPQPRSLARFRSRRSSCDKPPR